MVFVGSAPGVLVLATARLEFDDKRVRLVRDRKNLCNLRAFHAGRFLDGQDQALDRPVFESVRLCETN